MGILRLRVHPPICERTRPHAHPLLERAAHPLHPHSLRQPLPDHQPDMHGPPPLAPSLQPRQRRQLAIEIELDPALRARLAGVRGIRPREAAERRPAGLGLEEVGGGGGEAPFVVAATVVGGGRVRAGVGVRPRGGVQVARRERRAHGVDARPARPDVILDALADAAGAAAGDAAVGVVAAGAGIGDGAGVGCGAGARSTGGGGGREAVVLGGARVGGCSLGVGAAAREFLRHPGFCGRGGGGDGVVRGLRGEARGAGG